MTPDVLVVGAGICGLAAAYELTRRGAHVTVLERTGVGAEQSAGLARIFRIAHADPRLCGLALEAREGWHRWAQELGTARLVGDEGLVSAGAHALERQVPALQAAGAPHERIGAREVAERLGPAAADHPWGDGLLDPLGGAIRVQRVLRALAATVELRPAEVVAVQDGPDRAAVRLAGPGGDVLHADRVLVCAGVEAPVLAATAGIALPMRFTHHVRLTYGWRGPARPSACFTAGGAYGLPLGSTGRFALGLRDPGAPAEHRTADADAFAAAVRDQHAAWVPRHLPGLDPAPVGEIRCVGVQASFLDPFDDGFAAARQGRVVAFGGSNLMKFAPVLGDRLARTVLADDEVHPDLALAR